MTLLSKLLVKCAQSSFLIKNHESLNHQFGYKENIQIRFLFAAALLALTPYEQFGQLVQTDNLAA
jgi:hypothetical protein